jgi:CBS domain-containing protein
MITDRDIAMATSVRGAAPGFIWVSAVMAPFVHTCRPADSIELALRIMQARRVSRLPVTEVGGRLVGILSLHDVVRAAAKARTRAAKPSLEDLVRTMAAVCEPRKPKGSVVVAEAQPPR